jgi:hypothetical protein
VLRPVGTDKDAAATAATAATSVSRAVAIVIKKRLFSASLLQRPRANVQFIPHLLHLVCVCVCCCPLPTRARLRGPCAWRWRWRRLRRRCLSLTHTPSRAGWA